MSNEFKNKDTFDLAYTPFISVSKPQPNYSWFPIYDAQSLLDLEQMKIEDSKKTEVIKGISTNYNKQKIQENMSKLQNPKLTEEEVIDLYNEIKQLTVLEIQDPRMKEVAVLEITAQMNKDIQERNKKLLESDKIRARYVSDPYFRAVVDSNKNNTSLKLKYDMNQNFQGRNIDIIDNTVEADPAQNIKAGIGQEVAGNKLLDVKKRVKNGDSVFLPYEAGKPTYNRIQTGRIGVDSMEHAFIREKSGGDPEAGRSYNFTYSDGVPIDVTINPGRRGGRRGDGGRGGGGVEARDQYPGIKPSPRGRGR